MSDNPGASCHRDILLENLAAELTSAAYAVALRHRVEDKWLDLELELWMALKEAAKKWGRESPLCPETAYVCDWAGVQSEVAPSDVCDGLGHRQAARWPLSGE
jgi:hypothetical protein